MSPHLSYWLHYQRLLLKRLLLSLLIVALPISITGFLDFLNTGIVVRNSAVAGPLDIIFSVKALDRQNVVETHLCHFNGRSLNLLDTR